MTTTTPQPAYEIRIVWEHGDVQVQHHFEPSDPRFEVWQAGHLKYIFVATRAWQAERRTAVEAACDLAGVAPPAPAVAPSGPRAPLAQKPVPTARITPLVYALAQLYRDANTARSPESCLAAAREVVYAHVAVGLRTFTELESEVQMGVNRSHFDFEAEGREKIIVYTSH